MRCRVMIVVATFAFARACMHDSSDEIPEYPEYGSPEYYAHAAELGQQRKPEGGAQYPPPPEDARYA